MKATVWVIGMTSFFSNAFVVSYHSYLCKTEMTSHKVILVNLALSDLVMSFYLIGLGTADVWHSGRYSYPNHIHQNFLDKKFLSLWEYAVCMS